MALASLITHKDCYSCYNYVRKCFTLIGNGQGYQLRKVTKVVEMR
jgi:hypothetical protein